MAARRNSGSRRRRTAWRSWKKKLALPGWALLLAGLALGVAFALLADLVAGRPGSSDGLAALFHERAQAPVAPPAPPRPEPRTPPVKPKLDFYTVLPEMETVLPDRGARPARARPDQPDESVRYVLQAGSFARFEEADELKARLALQGLQAHIQKVTIEGKGEYHRVRLGPYDTLDALDAVNRRLTEMGIQTLRLKVRRDAG